MTRRQRIALAMGRVRTRGLKTMRAHFVAFMPLQTPLDINRPIGAPIPIPNGRSYFEWETGYR